VKDILRASYDRSAARYDSEFRALQRPKYEALLGARADALAGRAGRAVDLGCGTGLLAEWLAERGGAAARALVGLDLSHDMARIARGRGVRAVEGDLERLPFRGAAFDTAFCFTALGLFPGTRDRAIAEIARVLAPGGLLAVTILKHDAPGLARDLAAAGIRAGPAVDCGQDVGHVCVKV
jgi:ubiquinone/menaquinone biosynthesis C-methylase UbiE